MLAGYVDSSLTPEFYANLGLDCPKTGSATCAYVMRFPHSLDGAMNTKHLMQYTKLDTENGTNTIFYCSLHIC